MIDNTDQALYDRIDKFWENENKRKDKKSVDEIVSTVADGIKEAAQEKGMLKHTQGYEASRMAREMAKEAVKSHDGDLPIDSILINQGLSYWEQERALELGESAKMKLANQHRIVK